jgi:hypothetical protein
MGASKPKEEGKSGHVLCILCKQGVLGTTRYCDMTTPGFDLILGGNTLKELRIVLDFWTKEITLDMISLPMRDINKL